MGYSAEDRLILLFSSPFLQESEEEIKELLKSNLDWQRIFRKVNIIGVSPLIYHHLITLNGEYLKSLPSDILEQFKSVYYGNYARNMVIYNELARILKSFKEHSIPTILLKGTFLAEIIYQDIALRPMTDIDILIKKENLSQANEALNSLGYISPPNFKASLKNKFSSLNTIVYKRRHPISFFVHLH
jgi:hypothetical protein